jgi:outer membrane receptor for ferrienterochelin and colicins
VRGVSIGTDRAYWSATIRGIGEPNDFGKRLLVLSDGAILNDDILNSSYIGSDGRTDLGDVERIEVVRGPGSLLYGTGAFSGVVNLVPHYRDYPSSFTAGASTYENKVARGRAATHVNFAKDAGMYASVAASRSEGFDLPVTLVEGGAAPERTIKAVDKFYSVTTAGSAWWRDLTAQWFYSRRKQQIPVGAVGTVPNDARTFYFDERALGEIRYEPKVNQYLQIFARAHANHYHFKGLYVLAPPDLSLGEDYYSSWFGVEARAVITPIKQLRITAGGEGGFHPFTALRGTEVLDDLKTPAEDGEYLNEESSYNLGAAYTVLETSPIEWFRASAGVRVDIYSTFGAIPIPRGALIFKPVKGGVLKLMGGRAFRAPSIYEQFYNDGGFTQTKGQDEERGLELKPESIISSEIEYSQRFLQDWVALASAHTSYIENIINTVEDSPGSDVIRYANSDVPALTIGGEVELRREWRQGWMLSAFYGYQRAQYLNPTDPALVDNPRLINAPEHLAGVKGVIPIVPEIASVGARATLEAPRRISLDSDDVTNTAVIADLTLSGFARRYGLRYVIGIYNLFDWVNEVPVADTYASRTMPQNGRTVLLDISLTVP